MRSGLASARLLVVAMALALALVGAVPGAGSTKQDTCDWGASSIAGEFVNGQFVVTSGPTTTGCVPPR
ncbi:MAG TPA: hypothetical protein VF063_05390 [Gaiellaceae bacterium]